MPGNQVRDWPLYHKLRRKGHSKESAARIANSRHMAEGGVIDVGGDPPRLSRESATTQELIARLVAMGLPRERVLQMLGLGGGRSPVLQPGDFGANVPRFGFGGTIFANIVEDIEDFASQVAEALPSLYAAAQPDKTPQAEVNAALVAEFANNPVNAVNPLASPSTLAAGQNALQQAALQEQQGDLEGAIGGFLGEQFPRLVAPVVAGPFGLGASLADIAGVDVPLFTSGREAAGDVGSFAFSEQQNPVSRFIASEVRPEVGEVARTIAESPFVQAQPPAAVLNLLFGENAQADLAESVAEALTPASPADIAVSLFIPATADWADAFRLARSAGLIDDTGRVLRGVTRGQLDNVIRRVGKTVDDLLPRSEFGTTSFGSGLPPRGPRFPDDLAGRQREVLKGQGFSDAEIDATFGLTRAAEPDDAAAAVRIPGAEAGTRPPAAAPARFSDEAISGLKAEMRQAIADAHKGTPGRPRDIDKIEGLRPKTVRDVVRLSQGDIGTVTKADLENALRKVGGLPADYKGLRDRTWTKEKLALRLKRLVDTGGGASRIIEGEAVSDALRVNIRPLTGDVVEDALNTARTGEIPPSLTMDDALGIPPLRTSNVPPDLTRVPGFDGDATEGLDYFIRERRAILAEMPANPSKIRRATTSAVTGVDDPWLAEELASEMELGDYLRHTLKDIDEVGISDLLKGRGGYKPDDIAAAINSGGLPETEMVKIISEKRQAFRDLMIADRFKNADEAGAILKRLQDNDIERMAGGITAKVYDEVNNFLRTMLLGIELPFAIAGQQGLRATRGVTAVASGMFARMIPRLRRSLYLIDPRELDAIAQLTADGAQFGLRGQTVDITKHGIVDRIPLLGPAADWVATAQFQHFLGGVRLRADEGLLLQNKAMHDILDAVGLKGLARNFDIFDPVRRRRILEAGNTFSSTSRPAVGARRGAIEQRGILSARLTRGQMNEALIPIRTLRSPQDAINTLNLVAGTALLFAAMKEINDEIGATDLVTDPLDFMFGRLTLNQKNSKGENIVADFLPQASFFKAVMRTLDAYQEEDWQRMAEAWAKYGAGRLSPFLSDALALGGFGWGRDGAFFYGEMPKEERWRSLLPLPITVQQTMLEGETDPTSVGLALSGSNAFGESEFGQQLRLSEQDYGKSLFDLTSVERVTQNMKIAESRNLSPDEHTAPYRYAGTEAFLQIQEEVFAGQHSLNGWEQFVLQFETMKQAREAWIADRMEEGMNFTDAENNWYEFLDAMGYQEKTRAIREQVIITDPSIVESLNEMNRTGDYPWGLGENSWQRKLADEVQNAGQGVAVGQ